MYTYYVKSKDFAKAISKDTYAHVSKNESVELQALGNSVTTAVKGATRALAMLTRDGIITTITVNCGTTESDGEIVPTVRIALKRL